ncbi:MAG: DUF4330 domain-containing protein [Defluviitaleaceae bacterium]|nr:DUF4330 domain-containing protein [Defluviitaleaceae bacterium]
MTKKRGRFNIIDGLIVLVLLGIAAFAVWFFSGPTGDEGYVYYVIEIRQAPPGYAEVFMGGGEIRDSVRNYFLGTVVHIRYQPAVQITFDHETLSFAEVYVPERYDIYLTIRGRGVVTHSQVLVEGQAVQVGMEKYIRMRGVAGVSTVVGIDTSGVVE